MKKIEHIIVQAGGLGSRLETLTINKPKCLVPIHNKPLIFHLFEKFDHKKFIIIADYKSETLERYLKVFAKNINYKIITTHKKGTCSGIKESLDHVPNDEPFAISWCDLLLPNNTLIPDQIKTNLVGMSDGFECRWSFIENKFVKTPSKENGVAGFFIFTDKKQITDVSEEGEFVLYLQNKNISFTPFKLDGSKEIGTMLSYNQNETKDNKCRPFNKLTVDDKYVIKTPIDDYGKKIAQNEINWYHKIIELGFKDIPKILSFSPIKMEKIDGKNIFEYQNFTYSQKRNILLKIVTKLSNLHNLTQPKPAILEDCYDNYVKKTFDRIVTVQNLIPFANDEYITINNIKCRNIFFIKDQIVDIVRNCYPKEFYLIHGDPTFSNIMLNNENIEPIFIDPRGYFGNSKFYGDRDYDWAKLYYSIVGNYDQFNRKNFALEIKQDSVYLRVVSNNWEDIEEEFFNITKADKKKIRILHALIWLSFTTYSWEDYDSICAAFYNGLLYLNQVIND